MTGNVLKVPQSMHSFGKHLSCSSELSAAYLEPGEARPASPWGTEPCWSGMLCKVQSWAVSRAGQENPVG